MRVAVHQPNLLPWLGFFAKVAQSDVLIVLDDVQFTKGGFTNRVRYRKRDGTVDWLTAPVTHDYPARIDRVHFPARGTIDAVCDLLYVAYHDAKHSAPILGDVIDTLLRASNATSGNLSATNFASATVLAKWLGLGARFERRHVMTASQLRREVVPGVEGLIGLVRAIGGTTYIAGAGASSYDDPAKWAEAKIAYRPAKFEHPVYTHGRGEFVPGLTALDVLMWNGFEAATQMLEKAIR